MKPKRDRYYCDEQGMRTEDGTPDPVIWACLNDLDTWDDHYAIGAAVAFGLMGMALAIKFTYGHLFACWIHSPPYNGGPCMRCGFDDGKRRSPQATPKDGGK